MTAYQRLLRNLSRSPRTWLVTGAAGFIGSNIVETLLRHNQRVIGFDNFSTGSPDNLAEVQKLLPAQQWRRFKFHRGDLADLKLCQRLCRGVDYVLHQAALGSVPRSIADPLTSNASNVTGFLHILVAARDASVQRFVYASSSANYGDHPTLPKVEHVIGKPLSPYAVTKLVNELYADVFGRCYALPSIGLRYFNVFGPRQDPEGPYAAVIPKWIDAMIRNQPVYINGDGRTSRDFCYVANAVQANLLAATTSKPGAANQIYNIAVQERTTLNALYRILRNSLAPHYPHLASAKPVYQDFRDGDVRHSLADISKARRLLGYQPSHHVEQGITEALQWYRTHLA